MTTHIRYVKTIVRPPSWWRHPVRWWRWREMRREHRELMKDPLYRSLVEEEERAALFGVRGSAAIDRAPYDEGGPL